VCFETVKFYTISVIDVDIFFLCNGEECVVLEECDVATCFLKLELGVKGARLPVERSNMSVATCNR
jgi:hypothetical protein